MKLAEFDIDSGGKALIEAENFLYAESVSLTVGSETTRIYLKTANKTIIVKATVSAVHTALE